MCEVKILTKLTLKYLPTGLMAHDEIRNHLVNSNANLRLLLLSWLPGNTSINQLLSGLPGAQMGAVHGVPGNFMPCSLNSFEISFLVQATCSSFLEELPIYFSLNT